MRKTPDPKPYKLSPLQANKQIQYAIIYWMIVAILFVVTLITASAR